MLAVKSGHTWNHSHADANSFIVFHKGVDIIKDGGNCWYPNPAYRNYFFQSQAHNVVLFNGEGQPREQQYSGRADWDAIRAVRQAVSIPVIANGDVAVPEDAVRILEYTGADGAMIGRGALGDPWIFERANALLETGVCPPLPPFAERMDTAVRQIELAAAQKGEHIAMLEARRHVNCYLKQQSGLKTFKNRICALERLEQLYEIVEELKQTTVSEE